MLLRPVSLDKNVHKYIFPKLCSTLEINSKYFGTGEECVGIGQTTVLHNFLLFHLQIETMSLREIKIAHQKKKCKVQGAKE